MVKIINGGFVSKPYNGLRLGGMFEARNNNAERMFYMNQEVFKQSIIGGVVVTIAIIGVFSFFFFGQGNTSPLLFLILLLPIVFIGGLLKTKLVIEDDVLRYEKIFGGEEISLKNVAQILTREMEFINTSNLSDFNHNRKQGLSQNMAVGESRSTQKVVYVMDDTGRTFFSFPASLVTRKDRRRFEDAVTAVNPNIQLF